MPVPAGGGTSADLYVDLPTVKAALGKPTADDRDELIAQSIRAACRRIDRRTGRRFFADPVASARTFPVGNAYRDGVDQVVLVDDIASADGLLVQSGTPWATVSGWAAGPDNAPAYGYPFTTISAAYGWVPSSGRIQVTARWGWPSVPDEIAEAAKLLSARLYRRKDSPQGVLGNSEWGVTRVSRTDPDVEDLIAAFIVPVIA